MRHNEIITRRDAEAYVGLWHGGSGYAPSYWATDAEVFTSLERALDVFEARAANLSYLAASTYAAEWDEDTGKAYRGAKLDPVMTPCVDDKATLVLVRLDDARLHTLDADGLDAIDLIVHFDARGVAVADPVIVYTAN